MNESSGEYFGTPTDSSTNGSSASASIYLAEYNITLNSIQFSALNYGEQNSIVNVTREYPMDYATIMFGYIMPFVLILTIVTNTLVVTVLAQRHMRTPTNIVLLTMAIVDMITLLSPSPWYFYIYTLGHHDKFLYPPICCYFQYIMTDVIPVFFHTSSIWLALLLASQRYIYVCHPTLASKWCTVARVKKAIIIILVVAFLSQITRFFDNTYEPVYLQKDFEYHLACKNGLAEWVQKLNVAVYFLTYFTFRILFVFTIPCVALITLNCLLFGALRRAETKRTELLKTKFKIIGGNNCSAKQSSQVIDGDRRATTENTSGLLMAFTRRPSGLTVGKQSKRKTEADKKRKFSISSFQMKRLSKTDDDSINNKRQSLGENLTIYNRVTSDNKSICSGFEPTSQIVEAQTSNAVSNEAGRGTSRPKEITRGALSRDSRDNFSMGLKAKNSCSADGYSSNKQAESNLIKAHRQQASAEDGEEEEEGQSTKEEYSTCLECATCKQNEESICQACAAMSNDGATCGGPIAAGDHIHQAVSQCSSLIGGATNTTTNEDVSSCIVTQNASSSMFVAHDGTMDGIEAASMRGEDVDIEQDNLSLHNNGSQLKEIDGEDPNQGDETKRTESKLAKSGSVDSRIACGCLPSTRTRSANSFRQSLTRTCGRTRRECRQCYLTEKGQNKSKGHTSSEGKGNLMKSSKSSGADLFLGAGNKDDKDKITKSPSHNDAQKKLPSSHSDYCNEASEDNKRSNDDTLTSGGGGNAAVTTTTTNTTTTTTLYSTTANSIGSLLQVQNQSNLPISRQQAPQMSVVPQARMKSPSFASSTGGRGSRATSVGATNIPGNLANTSASIRTMDSNRTTLMLIVVVTVFLIVEVPSALVTILHVVFSTFEALADIDIDSSFNYIKLFINFFIMISYSVNFTIYCSMSKKFRETFRDIFLCGKRDKRKRFLYQQQQHSQYNQHQFNNSNNPDNQVTTLNPTSNNNATTLGCAPQNDFTTSVCGLNHSLMRYYPYRRSNSQQQECEL